MRHIYNPSLYIPRKPIKLNNATLRFQSPEATEAAPAKGALTGKKQSADRMHQAKYFMSKQLASKQLAKDARLVSSKGVNSHVQSRTPKKAKVITIFSVADQRQIQGSNDEADGAGSTPIAPSKGQTQSFGEAGLEGDDGPRSADARDSNSYFMDAMAYPALTGDLEALKAVFANREKDIESLR